MKTRRLIYTLAAVLLALTALEACSEAEAHPEPRSMTIVLDASVADVVVPSPEVEVARSSAEGVEALVGDLMQVKVVELVMTSQVEGRAATAIGDEFEVGGERAYAYMKVDNPQEATSLKMIWKHEGKRRFAMDVNVGSSPGWKTWSYSRFGARHVGAWTVEVVDADGRLLAETEFAVVAR